MHRRNDNDLTGGNPQQAAAAELQDAVRQLVAQQPQAVRVPPQRLTAAVPGRGRGRGGRQGAPTGPPRWDLTKCRQGVPQPFGPAEAAQAVQNADFRNAVFIKTSEGEGSNTRKAFTYVHVGGFRICVGADIHPQPHGAPAKAGHAFIFGFLDWQTRTPAAAVRVIEGMPDQGTFPGADRYPQ